MTIQDELIAIRVLRVIEELRHGDRKFAVSSSAEILDRIDELALRIEGMESYTKLDTTDDVEMADDREIITRLARIETQIETLVEGMKNVLHFQREQDERMRELEIGYTRTEARLDNMEKRVGAWNVLNSVGAVIAAIIAWLK